MFLEQATPSTAPELQAVILAGYGNRLYPLTDGGAVPKALLPVANRPFISYQLEWLENANIQDIIIAAYPDARQKISGFVQKMYEGSGVAKIQIVEVPDHCGSADALRSIKSKIKTDFIVISCDLVTDIPAHYLINSFRLQNPAMTAFFYDAASLEASAERPASKDDSQVEYVGIDDKTSRLMITASKAELEDDLDLRVSMVSKFPVIHLHSQLRDAHLYIFRRWVLELIAKNKNITSIKNDLVPLLLECQHRDSVVKREGIDKLLAANTDPFRAAMLLSTSGHETHDNTVVCNAVVYLEGFTARGNTIWSYSELNRHMVKMHPDERIPGSAEVSPKTQVGQDSLVGEGTKIDERCSIKKSVIGNHCKIGSNVKITNSIIMDYAHVEDGSKLEECVVCPGAKIGAKSQLKDCKVGAQKILEAETVGKNETYADYLSDEESA